MNVNIITSNTFCVNAAQKLSWSLPNTQYMYDINQAKVNGTVRVNKHSFDTKLTTIILLPWLLTKGISKIIMPLE